MKLTMISIIVGTLETVDMNPKKSELEINGINQIIKTSALLKSLRILGKYRTPVKNYHAEMVRKIKNKNYYYNYYYYYYYYY